MRIPLPAAIFLLVITVLVDLYISHDVKSTGKKNWWKFYNVTAALCWIFLIVILCFPLRSENNGIMPVMWMLYTYISIYFAKIGYVVCSLIGKLVRLISKSKSRRHPARWVGVAAAAAVFVIMWVGVGFTRRHIVVNRVDMGMPQIPRPFSGYKIAQISDLHVGTWGTDTTFLATLVDSINSLKPDLIVFTGDIVNRKTEELTPFLSVLSRLKAPDGVLSVLGNHDYGDYVDWEDPAVREENNRQLAAYQKDMGWRLLNNEKVFISQGNDSIMIVGVENWGDPPFHTYGDLEKALSSSADSLYHQNDRRFKILLTHNPEHWNQVVSHSTNFGLTLSGHTHAMQMMVGLGEWKWSPAKYRYEQWGGLYERLNDKGMPTKLYVNIGAGEVGMPSRLLGAYPEITLLTLRHVAE